MPVIHAYHGSPKKFDEFCFDFVGTEGGTTGAGFGLYFTENEAEAFAYGENVYQCTLNLLNPVSNDQVTLNSYNLHLILNHLYEFEGYNYFANFMADRTIVPTNDKDIDSEFDDIYDSLLRHSTSDTDLIKEIINMGCPVDKMMRSLVMYGFDHTVDHHESDDLISKHYIVYDCGAISIVKKYTLDNRG